MPGDVTYDYAVIRVVPRVDRGEQINVGVILSCPDTEFLEARIELDEAVLRALDPNVDLAAVRANLDAIPEICRGGTRGRPDRAAAGARPLPVAGVAAEHDRPAVAGPHR